MRQLKITGFFARGGLVNQYFDEAMQLTIYYDLSHWVVVGMSSLQEFVAIIAREVFAVRQELERVNQLACHVKDRLEVILASTGSLSMTPEVLRVLPEGLQLDAENKKLIRQLNALLPGLQNWVDQTIGQAGAKIDEIRTSVVDARLNYPEVVSSEELRSAMEVLVSELDLFFNRAVSASEKQSRILAALKMLDV
ncbi:hypothetical protein LRS56_05800 [Pseudomonas poae]|nr:hypothetical protein LRS56_05800 [Pseudomonas poae]